MGPGFRGDNNTNYFSIPTCRGSHSVNSGISVIASSDINSGISHGKIAIVVRSIDNFDIRDSTNSTMPSGGCNNPIIRLSVITTPKCTGSIPTLRMIGISTGTRMLMEAMVSRKQPTTSSSTLIRSRMIYLLSVKLSNAAAPASVSRVVVNTQPNSEAAATTSRTPAVVSMVSIVTL